ncbi:MAG TPA: DUF6551 family protein [Azospirillum sp.]|nr:DUF6551 family protein [Azospirillum sp.]
MSNANTPTKIAELSLKGLKPAADLGERPEFLWMPVDWLFVDGVYQRAMTSAKSRATVRKIVEHFSWSKFTPLVVTELSDGYASGRFVVIDGQHRAAAAILHPDIKEVPVWVVDAPEVRQQAQAFVGINGDRTGLTTLQLFKGQVAAGDPYAVAVQRVCEQAGITIVFSLNNGSRELPPRQTMAVSTIRKMLVKHGEGTVAAALSVLAEAYHDTPNQLRGQVISAVTTLMVEYADRVERDRLVTTLRAKDCEDLIDAARQVKRLEGGTTEAGLVRAIAAAYDAGLTQSRRLRVVARAA